MSHSTGKKELARSNSINYFNLKTRTGHSPKGMINLAPLQAQKQKAHPNAKPTRGKKKITSIFSNRDKKQHTPQSSTRMHSERGNKYTDLLDRLIEKHSVYSSELIFIKSVFEKSTKEDCHKLKITELNEENFKLKAKVKKLKAQLKKFGNDSVDQGNNKKLQRSRTTGPVPKLNLKTSEQWNFQDEFMSNADHFSDSWRLAIKDQKLT